MFRKTYFIRQHDSMQCGVACLGMICAYFGRPYSQRILSKYCHATKEGVSALGISQAARALRMGTRCIKCNIDSLKSCQDPSILHWNQNHFVVLYGRNWLGRYKIADPGKGMLTFSESEFLEHWTSDGTASSKGVALLLQPTKEFYTHHEEVQKKTVTSRFLIQYFLRFKKEFLKVLLLLSIGSALQLLLPFLTQAVVDRGIAQKNLNLIHLILLGQLMLTFSRAVADFIRSRILMRIGLRINISLVSDFLIKLLKLPMGVFDVKLLGDLQQRMRDHDRIKDFLTNQVLTISFAAFSFLMFFGVLLSYDISIFLAFLIGTVVYGIWLLVFLEKRKALDYLNFEKQAENNNVTVQLLSTMQEIKLQSCENRRRKEWVSVQDGLYEVNMKILKLKQAQEAGSILINETKNIVVTIMAATAVIGGQMTLGMMLAVQYIIGQLSSPVIQFAQFVLSLQDVRISLERISEVHDMEIEDTVDRHLTQYAIPDKTIVIDGVDFKYNSHSSENILTEVSAIIPENKVTAIVGASGSGKTTLLKLLLGFYSPQSGNIVLANEILDAYNMKWWRGRCGVVMQEGVIFSESIARNIAVDDADIDVDRLYEASRIACADEFIQKLPLKYDTKIGKDGMGLSKGQQQRILIARAVYKQPDFIMLDEATNSLDASNERKIVENLSEFYKGRTVIVIAHRLSTVRDADNILVMQHGKIVEQGTHEELTLLKGVYYGLVRNQLELGQ